MASPKKPYTVVPSGALVVDEIPNASPDVAGLEERLLVIRDNPVPGNPTGKNVAWDLFVNYIPVAIRITLQRSFQCGQDKNSSGKF